MKKYPVLAALVLTGSLVSAQDNRLAMARDLYASAAYDDALAVLNTLRASDHPADQGPAIDQYRAYCLLALGRSADAEQAIEAVVTAEPMYQPNDADISPRVRSAFAAVRRRMLPSIVQQTYAQAKAAFDRKDYPAAARGFTQVLATLGDKDLAAEASRPPLSDLKTLAVGFEELSAKAAAPPPPPPAAPAVVAAATVKPAPPKIYAPEDPGVTPPNAISQAVPAYQGQVIVPRTGRLEIVIDEAGTVESAVMKTPISVAYDALVVAAAKRWSYTPATVNGAPVKFRKSIQIAVKQTLR